MTYAGQLLVAAPALADPNFRRAVLLLLSHGPEGALGVILNRASDAPVESLLSEWTDVVPAPVTIFEGGPVQPDSAICLARARPGCDPPGWSRVLGRLGTVDVTVDPPLLLPELELMRVFAGYAGWAPGQLESEIDRGGWLVLDLLPSDPFAAAPETLWRAVLRRQPGLLAAVATFPADPSLN